MCFDLTNENLGAIVVTVSNKAYRKGERMTRKDYKVIAKAMRDVLLSNEWKGEMLHTWACAVLTLETALKADNPRFDSERFREACGL